ncbi:MAG: amino acid ABC transporter permease [Alphaproteobacteria bacterium]|nr:amino acid ABC transporter permease [Alphaproteobacteria bacterium]
MSWDVLADNAGLFWHGFQTTLLLALASWAVAASLSIVVAPLRVAPLAALRAAATAYVEFTRNVPPIVIVFFAYFALPNLGVELSPFAAVVAGVGFYGGAMFAEIIRSGISAIPRGQYESATAQGMSFVQAMRLVILPQALRLVVPPLGTETINIIKNTSLGAAVSMGEILGTANLVGSRTFAYVVVFVGAGVLYLALTLPTAAAFNALERRLARR